MRKRLIGRTDQDVVREGEHPTQCCVVLEGMAFRYKVSHGGRQILSFHVAGEMPDLLSIHLDVMDHTLAAIGGAKLGFIHHRDIRAMNERWPRIADGLWRETLIDAGIFRQWIANLGRRDAPARLAHLFCELYSRMEGLELARDLTAPMPLTQEKLADALGLSTTHVNRSVQELRNAGLIALKGATLTILDWEGLKRRAEFDPSYLHAR